MDEALAAAIVAAILTTRASTSGRPTGSDRDGWGDRSAALRAPLTVSADAWRRTFR
jgi:hypothetical protein